MKHKYTRVTLTRKEVMDERIVIVAIGLIIIIILCAIRLAR